MIRKTFVQLTLTVLAVLLLQPATVNAQDTTVVQTFTFDSITTRRATFQFPDSANEYRRILMHHRLKCDQATTADQYPCGEWDYLTYTYVYDHTGEMDSTALSHPYFLVGGVDQDTVRYNPNALYNIFQDKQYFIVYDSVISESNHLLFTGPSGMSLPFATDQPQTRVQYLWTETELTAAGMTAGSIDKMGFDIAQLGEDMNHLNIRMRHTTVSEITGFVETGWTTVYDINTAFPMVGQNVISLTNPFTWDGTSNIMVEFSYKNQLGGLDHKVPSGNTTDTMCVYSSTRDGFVRFDNNKHIMVPMNGYDFGDEVTISCWMYGDPNVQPQNSSLFEAADANNNRVLNAHLPWSNSQVYWDAGEGSGYDRINKTAAFSNFAGQWNHWAFTKDAVSGEMKIYLNGNLWHSGTAKDRTIGEVEYFFIGKGRNGSYYNGNVDEFRVWDKVLSANTIAEWMYKDVDNTHPDYNDLVLYFQFNDDYASNNEANNNLEGILVGSPTIELYNGTDLFRNSTLSTIRPTVGFVQGDYQSHLDSVINSDTIIAAPISIVEYQVVGNTVEPFNVIYSWEEGYAYTYDHNGMKIDSTFQFATVQMNNYDLNYFSEAFEVIDRYEIGRFITPYGIGLDLGPEGFSWVYDVTDYAFLLQGNVDISSGNNQELLDLKFEMIKGTPPRDVVSVDRIWGTKGSYRYSRLADDTDLSAVSLPIDQNASSFKVRTRITGHGHNSNDGSFPHCCEWRDNTHSLLVNGTKVEDWSIFKYTECALNPVYPQGGTWPGAREGWCPGDVVKDVEFEITDLVTGPSVTLDYDITDVPLNNLGMGNGNYHIAMHLMQYSAPNHSLDAEVYDIISPNNWEYYSRTNPICKDPKIVIRNSGTTTLTSLTIEYGVSGGTKETYEWTGSLEFMEQEEVTLPVDHVAFWSGDDKNKFEVNISAPNGGTDEYADNDIFTTSYNIPDVFPDRFIVEMKTNNVSIENDLTIRSLNGLVVYSLNNLANNTTYKDTLDLEPGCYTLELNDSGNDGLSYWANPNAGSGSLQLWEIDDNDQLVGVKGFESEFGRQINYSFSVGLTVNTKEPKVGLHYINAYPNPAKDAVNLDLVGVRGDVSITMVNTTGQVVWSQQTQVQTDRLFRIQAEELPAGLYFINVVEGDRFTSRKVVIE